MAELVLVTDNMHKVRLEILCKRCKKKIEEIVDLDKLIQVKQQMLSTPCSGCSALDFDANVQDIVDHLEELALKTGAKIEVISSKTEDGRMLESLGKVAAILRYRMQ
jgi:peptide chain release factor subunit 1